MNLGDISKAMSELDNWGLESNSLKKTFEFQDFQEAMNFVNKIAILSEERGHHPDILIKYNTVTLILKTHSSDSLTELDIKLAKSIDALIAEI